MGLTLVGLPNHTDDLEEYDIFGSGGGFELESDGQEHLNLGISRVSLADPVGSNGAAIYGSSNGGTTRQPSDKDVNQGTLVVFNLDPSVSNDDLRQIFGAYGEIKEIRETLSTRSTISLSNITYVRAAEAALSLVLQSAQEPEQDDSWTFRIHRVPTGTFPLCYLIVWALLIFLAGNWPKFGSPIEHGSTQSPGTPPGFTSPSPTVGNNLHGLASILHPRASNTLRVAPIGEDRSMSGHADFRNGSNHGAPFPQSQSFPEPKISQFGGTVSSLGA
ncbi:hypothetical protein HAX54_035003 [Datura stramonium]|uniref:RRM domain-containing protein n=1 Tax=Datura stramonium TaxID=4076 RepID=A0ABS8SF10_DATST|nr:hypothetical protein [Datura stramonium]